MERPISRRLRVTFFVHTIVASLMGVVLLLVPVSLGNLVNWDMSDVAYRIVGAAMFACGLSSFLGYKAEFWGEVKIVLEAKVSLMVISAIVLLWALLDGRIPGFGWLFFVILAGFAITFGSFLISYRRAELPGLSATD